LPNWRSRVAIPSWSGSLPPHDPRVDTGRSIRRNPPRPCGGHLADVVCIGSAQAVPRRPRDTVLRPLSRPAVDHLLPKRASPMATRDALRPELPTDRLGEVKYCTPTPRSSAARARVVFVVTGSPRVAPARSPHPPSPTLRLRGHVVIDAQRTACCPLPSRPACNLQLPVKRQNSIAQVVFGKRGSGFPKCQPDILPSCGRGPLRNGFLLSYSNNAQVSRVDHLQYPAIAGQAFSASVRRSRISVWVGSWISHAAVELAYNRHSPPLPYSRHSTATLCFPASDSRHLP